MRPKGGKNIKGGAKTKRHKNNNEAQAAYHSKINARRSKKMKK
jgi:type VI protein secretion system component Hcp